MCAIFYYISNTFLKLQNMDKNFCFHELFKKFTCHFHLYYYDINSKNWKNTRENIEKDGSKMEKKIESKIILQYNEHITI